MSSYEGRSQNDAEKNGQVEAATEEGGTSSPEAEAGGEPDLAEQTRDDEKKRDDAACETNDTTDCMDRGAGERTRERAGGARDDRDKHAGATEEKLEKVQDAAQSSLGRTIGSMNEANKMVDDLTPDAGIDPNVDTSDSIPIPMPTPAN